MIRDVYRFISSKLGGQVTLENLAKIFDARQHPSVLTRSKTPEEAFNEYVRAWGGRDARQPIEEEDFVRQYLDMSGCVERDDVFEKTLKFPFSILM